MEVAHCPSGIKLLPKPKVDNTSNTVQLEARDMYIWVKAE